MSESFYIAKDLRLNLNQMLNAIFIGKTTVYVVGKTDLFINFSNLQYLIANFALRYTSLVDLWCVDYLEYFPYMRFELNYRFRSLVHLNYDIICSIHLATMNSATILSVSALFPSADWLEREIMDLYGVFFIGNKNMRRILTDYGFSGYPFRKDFPLSGYMEIRYDDEQVGLTSESIALSQNFRVYSNLNGLWQ